MSLLRIITIITYYYVFETGQLADEGLGSGIGISGSSSRLSEGVTLPIGRLPWCVAVHMIYAARSHDHWQCLLAEMQQPKHWHAPCLHFQRVHHEPFCRAATHQSLTERTPSVSTVLHICLTKPEAGSFNLSPLIRVPQQLRVQADKDRRVLEREMTLMRDHSGTETRYLARPPVAAAAWSTAGSHTAWVRSKTNKVRIFKRAKLWLNLLRRPKGSQMVNTILFGFSW